MTRTRAPHTLAPSRWPARFGLLAAILATACGNEVVDGRSPEAGTKVTDAGVDATLPQGCSLEVDSGDADFAKSIGCLADFEQLASTPIDATLPGARSVKVVLDRLASDELYFQNSKKYQIHYQFASAHLSGDGLPLVPSLSSFNQTEYYSPDRRFILGAVTHYEAEDVWAFELSPYDTASAEMIEVAFKAVQGATYFGKNLVFHPTSSAAELEATHLSADIPTIATGDLYGDYQPLTLGSAMGRLHFVTAAELETEYLSPRDIVVLEAVPNDIAVVSGLITQEFQTPLSHINVLAQNRGTPNMGLRNAMQNKALLALAGKWVELSVTATEWRITEVTSAEANEYWEAQRPEPVELPELDLSITGLWDIETIVTESDDTGLRDGIKEAVRAFGGKAAQYSILARTENVPVRKAFAIPVSYYDQFMRDNGFYDRIDSFLADAKFQDDPALRDERLAVLREDMGSAPVDEAFQAELQAKLAADYPGLSMRFRTSTNSEDLEGFPCAGCYESHTGDVNDWPDMLDAIRETWASIWLFRTFEERSYYGIAHKSVGMALLVHHNFPDEEANGVAITANPFDASGLEPAFYVNVQWGGEAEVVHPPPGVSSDEFLYFFDVPNQPTTYLSHSNLVEDGETVLSSKQIHELGNALAAIHARFSPAYGAASGNTGFYAMDIEFKFDDEDNSDGDEAVLVVKQARPYPGRGN